MGLGSYWGEVMEVLREIIPVYDKVNSIISLGKDVEHRNRGISKRVLPGNKILDAGSGFGNMSKTALKLTDGEISITLYDPLVPMLKNTGTHFEKTPDMANGVFEHIPFKDEEFDAVLCGYSLRDAINLRIAISEIHRVLKKDGRFVIVDLGKPDEPFIRAGVSFYLRCILANSCIYCRRKTRIKVCNTCMELTKDGHKIKNLEELLLRKIFQSRI